MLHELGLQEAAARRREEFDAHLRGALSLTRDPAQRTRIALDLGRALASCGEFRGSVELFHQALTGGTAIDDAEAVALEAEMLAMATGGQTGSGGAHPPAGGEAAPGQNPQPGGGPQAPARSVAR